MCLISLISQEQLENLIPEFPIDIEALCSLAKCQILKKEINSPRVYFLNNTPYIIISNKLPIKMFREKLAHELGHIILEHHNDSRKNYLQKENEADRFALFLLIPNNELKKQIKIHNNEYELADYFGVTPTFMRKRLKLY